MLTTLVWLGVQLVILGVVVWLVNYVLDQFPPRDPVNRIMRVGLLVVAVIIALVLLYNALVVVAPQIGPP